MKITEEMTFGALKQVPEFSDFADYIMVQSPEEAAALDRVSIAEACGDRSDLIVRAAAWVQGEAAAGRVQALNMWSESEKRADPEKERTGLLFFPGRPGRPYVILCAGGAYVSVCNALEGFPAAQVLAEKGYHVFILTYRVGTSPLLPKPQEDLAQAIRFIEAHAEALRIMPGDYAVCGFSAGAHLAASFGTDHLGYAAYGVPKPGALILAYAAISAHVFDPTDPTGTAYISTMIGPDWTKEKLDAASVECDMSGQYPPTFLTHSRDDGTVPFRSSELLAARLEELRIPHCFKPVDGCDHGFSTGFGESAGWLDEACSFFEDRRNARWFSSENLNDHIIRIQGASIEYMYLIEGEKSAALIDTGTGIGDLHRYIAQFTDKPIKVLLSHGHMDHALGTPGFHEIYMNPLDDHVLIAHSDIGYRKRFIQSISPALAPLIEEVPIPKYLPIRNGQEWDLGGITIEAFECSGHTVGSTVFLLKEDRILFLGDACNSNTLVYDPAYSATVEEYRDSLIALQAQTKGLYDHTIFSHESEIKGNHLVPQMIDLCTDVLNGISDEEPTQFVGDWGLMAKARNEQGRPKDGSDVNFMYLKDRIFKSEKR